MPTVLVDAALRLDAAQVGPRLLQLAEDQWFDRKSIRVNAQGLADAEISFANAEGGTIVVGLHAGRVEGTDSAQDRRNALMQAAIDFTHPPVRARSHLVECINADGRPDHLLVVEVEPSEQVHANNRDEVFLRVGDESRRLSFVQRQELLYDKGQSAYESTAVPETDIGDVNLPLLENYAAALGHPDAERLLRARGFATTSGDLTVAGLLLFGDYPQAKLPTAIVRIIRYRGLERGTGARQQLLEDVRCEGPIPAVLGAANAAIQRLQPTRRALAPSGRFEPMGLVPEDAWLEGMVNAVVHRSYSVAGDHIRVEIFDDRIEIESPGRFPGLVALNDPLNTTRFARNPRIARVCADLNFGQELGEGIRRIFEEMRLAGLADPLYVQTPSSVRLTLSGTPVDRALEARLPPASRQVLTALRDAGRLGTGDLAQVLGVSRPVAIRRLTALRDVGLIEWVGNSPRDPRAFWQLPTGG
jgi:ATP-dependent DNA helicase RecG